VNIYAEESSDDDLPDLQEEIKIAEGKGISVVPNTQM
jgi:hypothetical protein